MLSAVDAAREHSYSYYTTYSALGSLKSAIFHREYEQEPSLILFVYK